MDKFIQYVHHRIPVWVRADLEGKHRDFCLCYSCALFKPGEPDNCPIAQQLFELDIQHHITTPIWECPVFVEKE